MALAAAGVSQTSVSLGLPCIIRRGNLAATNGPQQSNSWSLMNAPCAQGKLRRSFANFQECRLNQTTRRSTPARFSGPIFRREVVLLYPASEGIVMKPLLFALCVMFAFGSLNGQTPAWQPSPGHTQVPIWPGRHLIRSLLPGRRSPQSRRKNTLDSYRPSHGRSWPDGSFPLIPTLLLLKDVPLHRGKNGNSLRISSSLG